ncbi:hypothetical protein GMRT_10995 [Giardia muris]|uniref:C2H2-type domain-containing protein n=1 Tax=Giardia muris TaxID=5742 RepID=A0A4Z1T0U2_GIAMU|nr:hypothetical protein GMRT_10995 [Giardia muris]|eukprot:TNJ29318.1 hypothetical protein GMRT_10995 [Giardia muris]
MPEMGRFECPLCGVHYQDSISLATHVASMEHRRRLGQELPPRPTLNDLKAFLATRTDLGDAAAATRYLQGNKTDT